MKKLVSVVAFLFLILPTIETKAQVGIGTTNPSGALDITSTDNGLLIPRVALTNTTTVLPVLTGTTSELVYNTATINDVTPGFYYLSTTTGPWVRLATTAANSWLITGNTGIIDGTNYIGTAASTNVDVAFRRNNIAAGKIGATSTSFGVGALAAGAATNSTAIGNNALSVSTGSNNVAVGQNALQNCNTTAQWNTGIGNSALKGINSNAAQSNTAIGFEAMTGIGNISNTTSIGYHALFQNTASNNTAIGYNSLQGNTVSTGNTAVGAYSLNNAGGSANTVLGFEAGFNAVGSNNVCIGYQSGKSASNATGNNVFIGYQTGSTTGSNNIAIGYNSQVDVAANSNQIRLGDQNILLATTKVSWTTSSDSRWKNNILNTELGLNFIKSLRPVSYFRKDDPKKKTEYGFVAQEVETALVEAKDSNNGIVNKDDNGMYGLRYNDFISISVKAIQEQQILIEKLIKDNELLMKRLELIENSKQKKQ